MRSTNHAGDGTKDAAEVFNKTTETAKAHGKQATAAVDAANGLSDGDREDGTTKRAANDCVDALKSAVEQSRQAIDIITEEFGLDGGNGGDTGAANRMAVPRRGIGAASTNSIPIDRTFADGGTFGDGKGLERFAAGIKMPRQRRK